MTKRRGRPAKYDQDEVLEKAMGVFWQKGLTATSLDELSDAMGMNRPSIYNAFGDKESLYRKSFAAFVKRISAKLDAILDKDLPLKEALLQYYEHVLKEYVQDEESLGCFVICTAPVESLAHPSVKKDLHGLIAMVDKKLEKRLLKAQQEGDWPENQDAKQGAKLLHGLQQSIAIRVRGGESKASLTKFYKGSLDLLC